MNKRKLSLDISKAIAMVFIVIGHVLQRTTPNYTSNWISSLMLAIGIPIFFFISGITCSYRQPLGVKGFFYDVIKRALMYMWPVVFFLLLRVGFYKQWETFEKAFSDFIDYPGWGLWVLWVLVWINLFIDIGLFIGKLYPKLAKLFASITLVIAFIIFICLKEGGTIPNYHFIGYDYFVIYTPIFFVGYLIGDLVFSKYNKWVSVGLLCGGLIATVCICIFVTPFYSSGYHIEEHLYIFYTVSLCAIVFYYGLSTLLEKVKIGKLIGFLGQFSLESYFLHLVLIKYWKPFNPGNIWLTILVSVGLVLLCMVNTFGVVFILYFIPFGHFLMFGRHWSFYKFENRIFDGLRDFCLDRNKNENRDNIKNISA